MEGSGDQIIVIGAGLSGLSCARKLQQAGYNLLVLEAAPSIGGRLQTDMIDGFRLDRGFQVLQTAYPMARQLLDYSRLNLQSFPPGASIRYQDRFHVLADPLRRPRYLMQTAFSALGSLTDRLRLLRLVRDVSRPTLEELFDRKEMLARDYLEDYGFSSVMIDSFFTPFLAGICLDPEIRVTSRFLNFVMRMFAEGDVAVPALGMGEIPKQLAEALPAESIICAAPVESVERNRVLLSDGRQFQAEAVVLATPEPETVRLLGRKGQRDSCEEFCIYFQADEPPVKEPFLILNGEKSGLLNSVTFPSMVSRDYAPPGKTLVAAIAPGVLSMGDTEVIPLLKDELRGWFGPVADSWRELRHYRIHHALPRPTPPSPNPYRFSPQRDQALFHCGEYETMPSIQWALYSGEKTAQAVMDHLSG